MSSLGAQLPEGAGPISRLHDVEQRLNRVAGSHILHLRPGYFMENLLWNRDLIATQRINGTPLRGDIAAVATERLLRRNFSGKKTQELHGQRNLTMTEATAIIGKTVGQPALSYVQFPYDAAEQAMLGMGLSADVVRNFIEMYRAFNQGLVTPMEIRSQANTTPTSFEAFATVFGGSA